MRSKFFQHHEKSIRIALVIVYFILLSLLITQPLGFNLSTQTVGRYGDNMGFIWMIGWFKQALFDLHQLPYKTHLLNFPYGFNLYTTEIAPLQILIALPFSLFKGPVFGYNISILSTFVLAGLCMCYWVYSKTNSRKTALIIGTAYAICPFHLAHVLSGHLNISAIQWFPLYFMGFFNILENKAFSRKNVLLAGIGLGLISLSSIYFTYMTLVLSAFLLIYFVLINRKTIWKERTLWKQLLWSVLISVPFLIVSAGPYVYIQIASGMQNRGLAEVSFYSASPTDFLLPFTLHPLWGKWVGTHFPRNIWTEATLYLGLPIIGFFLYWVFEKKKQTGFFRLIVSGAILAFILALGTNFTWLEKAVTISTPARLTHLINQDSFPIYLPGYVLFRFIPFYGRMRVWMRYGIFVMTFVCIGAGFGINKVLQKNPPKKQFVIFVFTLGVILLDFWTKPLPLVPVQPRKVDEWLAGQPYGGLVQMPFDQSYNKLNMYYTLTNQKALIGYIKEVPSYRYFRLQADLNNFPDKASIDAIKAEKITYVLVDESKYSVNENFVSTCRSNGLDLIRSIDGQAVFVIRNSQY